MDAPGTAGGVGVVVISIVSALVGVLLLLAFIAVVARALLRHIQRQLAQRVAALYRPEDILLQDLRANSFGQASTGRLRMRGNGGLVLTRRSLHFFLFMPRADLTIPLEAIADVAVTRSHLGKAALYPLLKVAFSRDGVQDSIAWYVADTEAWVRQLAALTSGGPADKP